jgi:hypothetical protein
LTPPVIIATEQGRRKFAAQSERDIHSRPIHNGSFSSSISVFDHLSTFTTLSSIIFHFSSASSKIVPRKYPDTTMTVAETIQPSFLVTPLPGKGMSVIATAPIPADTLLFSELPLLLLLDESHSTPLQTRVLAAFNKLPPKPRAGLLSLCSNLDAGRKHADEAIALGVWKANNFCLDSEGTVNGIFELAARLNHACIGGENCRWEWNPETREMAFYTVRDIEVRLPDLLCGD